MNQLSVDHVLPQQAVALGFPPEWILDAINQVACCRACNDFDNRRQPVEPAPPTLEGFLVLRDATFLRRSAAILERRARERAWFEANVRPKEPTG